MIAATSHSDAHRRSGWAATMVVVGAGVVASLQVGKGAIAGPLLQADFGIDLGTLGWLTSVFAILGMVGGIPAGALTAKIGDRRMLCLGLGAIALGAALGAVAGSFHVLLAGRVVEGLGFLLISVSGPAILQRVVAPATHDLAFSLWSCFMPAGMAIAMLAGPQFGDWRALWWSSAFFAGAAIIAAVLLIPKTADRSPSSWRGLGASILATLSVKGPSLLAASFTLYSLMFFALFSFLPVLLMDRMNVSLQTAGLLSAVAVAVNILGNLAAGVLLSRGLDRSAMVAGASVVMGISGLGIFLPVFLDTATFLLCVMFSAVGGLIPATLLATAPIVARTPNLTPIAVGLVMQGSALGQVIAPVAVGRAIAFLGWHSAAVIVGFATLLVVLLTVFLRRPTASARRPRRTPP